MTAPAWEDVQALTFDCYGTLVDWETGIARGLRQGLPAISVSDDDLLARFAATEPAVEEGPFIPYRDVLREVLARIARWLGVEPRDPEALLRSHRHWPVFPDTTEALRRLQQRFRLCVASNVDRDMFAHTEQSIGIRFDEVVTADQVRSYKPAPAHFEEACRRLGLSKEAVVHVGQSLHHDIVPAGRLGLRTVWVDRSHRATRRPDGTPAPDLVVRSLAELVQVVL